MSLTQKLVKGAVRVLVKPSMDRRVPIALQRRWLRAMSGSSPLPRGVIRENGALGGVRAEFQRPPEETRGVVLYLHGGAYIIGSPATHRNLTMRLARVLGSCVYVVDYRLAPEHPFPAALEDAVAAYRGLLQAGYAPGEITLAGDSAGGGLTLATALRLRQEKLPQPGSLVTLSPWVDLTNEQLNLAVNDAMLKPSYGNFAAGCYLNGASPRDPLASPIYGDLTGLAPLLVQVGSEEMLLNDARRIVEKATQAGVHAQLQVFPDMWHVFQAHAGLLDTANQALEKIAAFVEKHR